MIIVMMMMMMTKISAIFDRLSKDNGECRNASRCSLYRMRTTSSVKWFIYQII